MSIKKEVFRSKVLQKLYPVPLKTKETTLPPSTEVDSAASKTCAPGKGTKPLKPNGDGGMPAPACRKLYTVLPPPDGYKADELPVVDEAPETTSKWSDGENVDEEDEDDDDEPQRKRRRRKKKGKTKDSAALANDRSAEGNEANTGSEVGPKLEVGTESERLSKNKKRKLKKKRRKEKLRSLGLAPSASAVDFTYQHKNDMEEDDEDKTDDGDEKDEDDDDEGSKNTTDEQADEVLEFLKTTLETYVSDRSCPERLPPAGTEALLSSLSDGTAPPGELARLCILKDLLLRRDADELRRAQEEFRNSTNMPPEASAVCVLLSYWITDIFPLQEVLKT
ncbi:glutamate-rich protein 1 isoform X2 [Engraulis encrasicolus]|uniref:glutamate-rich protein 1 isoform X2 n=1 Tax=Engraulis encrasicolus TaxID=184585 RepID=UPI002FD2630D